MRRIGSKQIEIFNFSFLDILACTIGLLIFIMVMIFVLQSGASAVADVPSIVRKSVQRADTIEAQAASDDAIAARLEVEGNRIGGLVDRKLIDQRKTAIERHAAAEATAAETRRIEAALTTTVTASAQNRDQLRNKIHNAEQELARDQKIHDTAAREHAQLAAQGAPARTIIKRVKGDNLMADMDVLHIDCHAGYVSMLTVAPDGTPTIVGTTQAADLDDATSEFQKRLTDHQKLDKPAVVFWVRPDGVGTFSKVRDMLPSGMSYGYEPASADWKFDH